ncbi:MAG TPA: tRNA (guanosine(37)-N1)-methyltransferase TrmD [Alphaproteobacteria bacterium]|nr:tRNA (guanosine(37)-N1)-methyltransferase TrmD [Alphaproteobacteria bacterium]
MEKATERDEGGNVGDGRSLPVWTALVLTLFPDMFPGPLGHSLAGTALKKGIWALETVDIRDFARDKHRVVDDTPAGGGPGMVMRPDILAAAIDGALDARPESAAWPLIYLSARGKRVTQGMIRALSGTSGATFVCGRFEGVDERVLEARGIEEWSLGDFVLSGGEPAAIMVIDAVVRLLPGVIGDPAALVEESFADGLLEYPQYTRPQEWEGRRIPEVLMSGHHGRIREWRRSEAERVTRERRPDLWERYLAQRTDS